MTNLLIVLQIGSYDFTTHQTSQPAWIAWFPLIALIAFAIGCYISYLIIVAAVAKAIRETVQTKVEMIDDKLRTLTKLLDNSPNEELPKGTNKSLNEIYQKILKENKQ